MNTDIITIKEVISYLKLTEKTACRLAAVGKFPGFKAGGSWRFRRSEVGAWIYAQSKTQNEGECDQVRKYTAFQGQYLVPRIISEKLGKSLQAASCWRLIN